jgi:hypothetical protein
MHARYKRDGIKEAEVAAERFPIDWYVVLDTSRLKRGLKTYAYRFSGYCSAHQYCY